MTSCYPALVVFSLHLGYQSRQATFTYLGVIFHLRAPPLSVLDWHSSTGPLWHLVPRAGKLIFPSFLRTHKQQHMQALSFFFSMVQVSLGFLICLKFCTTAKLQFYWLEFLDPKAPISLSFLHTWNCTVLIHAPYYETDSRSQHPTKASGTTTFSLPRGRVKGLKPAWML